MGGRKSDHGDIQQTKDAALSQAMGRGLCRTPSTCGELTEPAPNREESRYCKGLAMWKSVFPVEQLLLPRASQGKDRVHRLGLDLFSFCPAITLSFRAKAKPQPRNPRILSAAVLLSMEVLRVRRQLKRKLSTETALFHVEQRRGTNYRPAISKIPLSLFGSANRSLTANPAGSSGSPVVSRTSCSCASGPATARAAAISSTARMATV